MDVGLEEEFYARYLILSECCICPDILYRILSLVPKQDLVPNCLLVCKFWKSVLDAQAIWKLKCVAERIPFPSRVPEMPMHFYRTLCFKNPFGRNLMTRPCRSRCSLFTRFEFEAYCSYWHHSGGGGWHDENGFLVDGVPLSDVPELQSVISRFARLVEVSVTYKLIDLAKEGCCGEVLDALQPTIAVHDRYEVNQAHSVPDASVTRECFLQALLLDADKKEVAAVAYGPVGLESWGAVHEARHCFQDYGPGVRYVVYQRQLGYHHPDGYRTGAGNASITLLT